MNGAKKRGRLNSIKQEPSFVLSLSLEQERQEEKALCSPKGGRDGGEGKGGTGGCVLLAC